jgi:hypothetical protein
VIDRKNATQAQKKCLHLDCQVTNIFYQSMDDSIFGEIMDMKSAHEIWIYLNDNYGAISDDDDEPNEEAHEDVEHDKVDDHASSDANDDATPCTLDGDDDGSCPNDFATTSPSTTPHYFMSQGDTKVSNANVVDYVD